MGSYKKIRLSHEMGLIDTPPLTSDYGVGCGVGEGLNKLNRSTANTVELQWLDHLWDHEN